MTCNRKVGKKKIIIEKHEVGKCCWCLVFQSQLVFWTCLWVERYFGEWSIEKWSRSMYIMAVCCVVILFWNDGCTVWKKLVVIDWIRRSNCSSKSSHKFYLYKQLIISAANLLTWFISITNCSYLVCPCLITRKKIDLRWTHMLLGPSLLERKYLS